MCQSDLSGEESEDRRVRKYGGIFCYPEMRIIVSKYDVKQEVTDKFSLRGRVFHKLREDILSGKYQEHEELKEVAIGEEMGVSRTPVREAFRQLELEGLIQIIPNK